MVAGPASGTLTVNAGFDGSADRNLLAGTDSLAPATTATITFTLRFDPNGLTGPFDNTADGSARSPTRSAKPVGKSRPADRPEKAPPFDMLIRNRHRK